jgi:hypothetical protein
MRSSIISALVLNVCVVGWAECQTGTSAPQGSAIFGGAQARGLAEREGGLDLVVQLFWGYDNDVLAEQSGSTPNQDRFASGAGGFASGVGASLTYSRPGLLYKRPGARGAFRTWVDSSIRYYPGLDDLTGTYHRFGLELSAPVSRRVTLYASPRADYSPRYSFQLFSDPLQVDPEAESTVPDAGDTPAPDVDYSIVGNSSFRYGVIAGATIEVGAHSTLDVDYGYTKRTSDLQSFEMDVRSAGVSFDHQFTRNASLKLGYSYQDGNHGSGIATQSQNIDIGVDYRKPLSQTRRTFLRFNTGSTVADSEATGRRVRATGSASFVHLMRRTWTGLIQYRRHLQYADGFDRPIFADAISSSLSGLVTRRMEVAVRASYSSGAVGLTAHAPRFNSYNVTARLRRALTRRLAGYAEGLFYHYAFDEDAARPPGLPQTFDRVGLRFGLSLWIPLRN